MTILYLLIIGLVVVIYELLRKMARGMDMRFDSLERKIDEINVALREAQEKSENIEDEVAGDDYDHTLDYDTWRERYGRSGD